VGLGGIGIGDLVKRVDSVCAVGNKCDICKICEPVILSYHNVFLKTSELLKS
jgi:hypothetical protein